MPWWPGNAHLDEHHFTQHGVPGYFALLLLLETGMLGVFVSLDFFLFYVFWEVMLLPMYFLIGIWGGPRKEYAAIKFFLYTLVGSVLMLLAIIALYYNCDPTTLVDGTPAAHTFDMMKLACGRRLAGTRRRRCSASTSSSVVWVGALHRLRHQDPDVPVPHLAARRARRGADADQRDPGRRAPQDGHLRHPAHQLRHPARRRRSGPPPPMAVFGAINIVYGAFCAMAQNDLKKLVAYSSVSHMGFCLLGMAAFTQHGHQRRDAADVQPRH